MISYRSSVRLLQIATAIGAVLAMAFLLWPVRVDVAPIVPIVMAAQDASVAPLANRMAQRDSILDANIFSPSRTAPDERTMATVATDGTLPVDAPADSFTVGGGVGDTLVARADDRVPALYGIVDGVDGRAALLRLDASRPGAHLYRVGDGAAGYRVRSIGADRAEITGPQGGMVLHLSSRGHTP
jgi:hypothetical protein